MATPLENEKLKRLTRRRRALVDEKSRILNRMQADLQAVFPGLSAITKDADNVWFLNFIAHSEELTKLARLRKSTILGIKGVGRKYASIISDWQNSASFSHDVDWVGPMIVEDARRLLELRTKIKTLEARCIELMGKSQIAQLIDSIPGFGPVCSSELAGEVGTIDRFVKEGSLAVYLGMANLDQLRGHPKFSTE